MPREEYRLVKNRKIARLCRLKRKNERGDMQRDLSLTQREIESQKERIAILEKQLKESEASRLYSEQVQQNQAEQIALLQNMIQSQNMRNTAAAAELTPKNMQKFPPNMEPCAQINDGHKTRGILGTPTNNNQGGYLNSLNNGSTNSLIPQPELINRQNVDLKTSGTVTSTFNMQGHNKGVNQAEVKKSIVPQHDGAQNQVSNPQNTNTMMGANNQNINIQKINLNLSPNTDSLIAKCLGSVMMSNGKSPLFEN